jgi:hypothetical protein
MDYPGNSNSKKEPAAKPEKIEKVITGEVVKRKPSLSKRAKDIFIGGDAQSVWAYVAYDILIPAVKDTLSDAVSMGIERMLFGDSRSPSGRRRASSTPTGYGYTNYSSYSKGGSRYQSKDEGRQISRRAKAAHNFDEIILETRAEAETVIERLDDLCDRYGQASVSDLYELVGIVGDYTDEKYGWQDMRGADVSRAGRDGFLLNLPRPEPLDR